MILQNIEEKVRDEYTSLATLNLGDSSIGDEGVKFLAQNTILTALGLGKNKIGAKGAKALAQNTTLTALNLDWISEEAKTLTNQMLERNKKLKEEKEKNNENN